MTLDGTIFPQLMNSVSQKGASHRSVILLRDTRGCRAHTLPVRVIAFPSPKGLYSSYD